MLEFTARGRFLMLVAMVALAAPSSPATGQGAPTATRVEEQVLVTGEPGMTYYISPAGQHLAAVVNRGSRVVVVYDGVDGPKFDEIVGAVRPLTPLTFSDDGTRYAYVGLSGQEYVYMVDGKELLRLPVNGLNTNQFASGRQSWPTFSPDSRHVHFELESRPPAGTSNSEHRIYVDGQPGPGSRVPIRYITFSPDGSRYAYNISPLAGNAEVLVVDGKPAPYPGGNPQFTNDSKSLFTTVARDGQMEVQLDGKPYLRGPLARVHIAPAGPLVIGVVAPAVPGQEPSHLTLGNRKIPGSECSPTPGSGGLDQVYFSADGTHWAARCNSGAGGAWVMVDGKKGQEYHSLMSGVGFTADGRGVYKAASGGKQFVVVGDQESEGYNAVTHGGYMATSAWRPDGLGGDDRAALVAGNRVAYLGRMSAGDPGLVLVVDGKVTAGRSPSELSFSPDGSRVAYASGGTAKTLVVDGVEQAGLPLAAPDGTIGAGLGMRGRPRYVFGPDGRQVAWFAYSASDGTTRGIAVDGKLIPFPDVHTIFNLTFTPDGEHLIWATRIARAPRMAVYVDGEPAVEFPLDMLLVAEDFDSRWSMGADGALTFITQVGDDIKRFRITPGTGTSVATMVSAGGRAGSPAADRPASGGASETPGSKVVDALKGLLGGKKP